MIETEVREIRVRYRSIDGHTKQGKYKTLAGAQRFAQNWVGETPEMTRSYAVSGDGIGRITASGVAMNELFPEAAYDE